MQRKASAAWQGGLRDGKGTLTTESKALSGTPYSFGTRVEGAPGIKPERIDVAVKAPGADRGKFDEAAQKAKASCPLSKVLKAEISMDARLDA